MKIKGLEIDNFMAIGQIHARLDERGLVLVEGENKDDTSQDSNGSGKSSFPDALSWCLFGITARGETGDKVVNRTAKRGTRVAVKLEDSGVIYQVGRHRKHKGHKNRLILLRWDDTDGSWIDITAGTDKATQLLVDRIVGCSPQVFNAAIYAGQEAMPDLPGMTDKSLKMLVEEGSGVSRLQLAHDLARSKAREAEQLIEKDVTKRELLHSHVATCDEDIESAKEDATGWEATKKDDLKSIKASFKSVSAEYNAAAAKYKAFEVVSHEAELDKLDEEIESVSSLEEALRDAQRTQSQRAGDVTYNSRDLENMKLDLERLKVEHKKIEDKLGAPCVTCGKPHEESDLDEVKRRSRERYEAKLLEAKAAQSRLQNAMKLEKSATKAVEEIKSQMPDVSAAVARRSKLMDEIYNSESEKAKLRNEAEQLKRNADNLKERFERTSAASNPYSAQIEKLNKRRGQLETALEELGVKMAALEEDLAIKKAAVRLFGPAGVRAHILDTVTPYLNARTSHYLTILSDGNIHAVWSTLTKKADGDMSEKFQIAVSSETGADNFGGLSGGEKRKVRLACAMALQDLVASRASKPIELFIADEIDQALDESGLERLMAILEDKASERGTVLAISHHSLGDWIRQSVTIVKKGGKSTMTGDALKPDASAVYA